MAILMRGVRWLAQTPYRPFAALAMLVCASFFSIVMGFGIYAVSTGDVEVLKQAGLLLPLGAACGAVGIGIKDWA